jgi:hypothetical protein
MALSAEHRPKFCSPSPAMVTSPYEWKILKRDVKQIINQSTFVIAGTVLYSNGVYANLVTFNILKLCLHYNYANTNNELTHELSLVLGDPTDL